VGNEGLMDDGGVAMRRLRNGCVVMLVLLFVSLAGEVLADTPTRHIYANQHAHRDSHANRHIYSNYHANHCT